MKEGISGTCVFAVSPSGPSSKICHFRQILYLGIMQMSHKIFAIFLVLVGLSATLSVGLHGYAYYLTPIAERAFRTDYKELKPSSTFSHGLGVLGATMIVIGVITYSSRKRFRTLWSLGKLSMWLEFHIFLCLLGPVLVVYHTTFKAGGIAAICLWTMLSVAASGLVGRFLYVLIPRNIKGSELDSHQINEEFDRIGKTLQESEIGSILITMVDSQFAAIRRPSNLRETMSTYLHLIQVKRRVKHRAKELLAQSPVSHDAAHTIFKAVSTRASLIQRSIVLLQVEKLFYYWHAIHLPFTAMMFITLIVHVGVSLWLGYRWMF
jgi:hypothetical protein